jgi:hypothetical protein
MKIIKKNSLIDINKPRLIFHIKKWYWDMIMVNNDIIICIYLYYIIWYYNIIINILVLYKYILWIINDIDE